MGVRRGGDWTKTTLGVRCIRRVRVTSIMGQGGRRAQCRMFPKGGLFTTAHKTYKWHRIDASWLSSYVFFSMSPKSRLILKNHSELIDRINDMLFELPNCTWTLFPISDTLSLPFEAKPCLTNPPHTPPSPSLLFSSLPLCPTAYVKPPPSRFATQRPIVAPLTIPLVPNLRISGCFRLAARTR